MKLFFLKILVLYIASLFGASSYLYPQVTREWVQRYNGIENRADIVSSMHIDGLSNVYIYGMCASLNTSNDIAVIKYNTNGTVIWSELFNGYGNSIDQVNASFLDGNGNSYITGFSADTNLVIKIITLKYDVNGALIWHKVFLPAVYEQGTGHSVTADIAGSIYTAGSMRKNNGTYDIAILKFSSSGNLTAGIIYDEGALSSESPVSICCDNFGNIYIFGSVETQSAPSEGLVLKFNSSLNLVWRKTLTGSSSGPDMPVKMVIDGNGKPVVCMGLRNNQSGLDYGIFRLDTNSSVLMQYAYNGSGNDQDIPYAVITDNANNVYVTGSSRDADTLGSEDIATIKLAPNGTLMWARRYNGPGSGIDYGTSLTADNQGNVYAGGASDKGGNHVEYILLKYNSAGTQQWEERYSRITNSEDFVYSAAVDNSNNVFITGISFDSLSDYDIATIKYSQAIGITPISNEIPDEFVLYQNYPNPFNPNTKIRFDISMLSYVSLKVYDIKGCEVASVYSGELKPGPYEADFNAAGLASGIYLYALKTPGGLIVKRMILLK